MNHEVDTPRENNLSGMKTEEIKPKPRMKDSSPGDIVDRQLTEKLKMLNIQLSLSGAAVLTVPSLEPAEKQNLTCIPLNEYKKTKQTPRRILLCFPPVVQELLRWSIHPQDVLRGAASVSHLLSLSTIEEESVPSVQTEAKGSSSVPRVKRLLPSIPPTENRALLSNQATAEQKTLSEFRAEFRKRMLPTLPAIKERISPSLREADSPQSVHELALNEASRNPEQNSNKAMCQLQLTEEEAAPSGQEFEELQCVETKEKERLQTRKLEVVKENNTSFAEKELPHLRAKLARRAKTVFQPSVKESRLNLHRRNTKPVLPSIQSTQELMIPKPPLIPKPSVPRMCREILATVNRPLPGIQQVQKAVMPKPPSAPKPTVTRTHLRIQATVNRPLPNIQQVQKAVMPNPPLTPKPTLTRTRPRLLSTVNRPLPPNLSSSSQQTSQRKKLMNLISV